MSMLEHALGYAAKGWPVLPIFGITAGFCTCGKSDCRSPGKHPNSPSGSKNATTDLERITDWWTKRPNDNIGIATGDVSGIFVIDVDVSNDKPGMQILAALEAQFGPLPRTNVVRTGSGGLHFYLAFPQFPFRLPKLGTAIDVKGNGGYVVAPPSLHASGNRYTWATRNA
jgi:hypothetical protein